MAPPLTDVSVLDQFAAAPFPATYPIDRRRLFVTVDQVQAAILYALSCVTTRQVLCMYSLDSEPLVAQIVANYNSVEGGLPTLIAQDHSCYQTSEGTRVAAPLVALRGQPNFRWSVGTSDRGQITHNKVFIGDSSWMITGSTNWSGMGMNEEDNECEFTVSAPLAVHLTTRIEQIYAWQIANCEQP